MSLRYSFFAIVPDGIIEIPQESNLSWLTLFYALPRELVEKYPPALSLPRNIYEFLLEQFVSRGMVVDFAVHSPDKEDDGISNPHFHVMCPIRPLDEHGRWGNKQRREYLLDEHGERIRDEAGNYVFNAVPTTDWGSPDTLEHWRQVWADLLRTPLRNDSRTAEVRHPDRSNPTPFPAVRQLGL